MTSYSFYDLNIGMFYGNTHSFYNVWQENSTIPQFSKFQNKLKFWTKCCVSCFVGIIKQLSRFDFARYQIYCARWRHIGLGFASPNMTSPCAINLISGSASPDNCLICAHGTLSAAYMYCNTLVFIICIKLTLSCWGRVGFNGMNLWKPRFLKNTAFYPLV